MRTHIADAADGYQWLDQLQDVQEKTKMTDFSHLHALEERAVRIRERMFSVENNSKQWKAQATQLFQTEKEIADERTFLGLEDMDADKPYAELLDDHESEAVREVTAIANSVEQAEQIRTAAEAVIEHLPGTRLADIAPDGLTVSFDGSVEFGDGGRGKGGCEYCGHELDETDPNPTTDGSPLICKECWRGETLNEPD